MCAFCFLSYVKFQGKSAWTIILKKLFDRIPHSNAREVKVQNRFLFLSNLNKIQLWVYSNSTLGVFTAVWPSALLELALFSYMHQKKKILKKSGIDFSLVQKSKIRQWKI